MVTKRTIQRRIKKGMTREQAETMPNMRLSGITKNDLLELSTLGLSRRGAASILGVSQTLVSNKIKEFGIDWVGKPIHNKKGQKNPNAICNKCELSGLNKLQVYDYKRRFKITLEQALEVAYSKKLKKNNWRLNVSTSQNEFKYPHYHKNVAHLKYVDVYRVIELFDVKDHAIGHAIKKLLCSGERGAKDKTQDVQEAISSLLRYLEMQTENENEK